MQTFLRSVLIASALRGFSALLFVLALHTALLSSVAAEDWAEQEPAEAAGEEEESDEEYVDEYAEEEDLQVSDPIEGFNRGMFWFNDKVDVYVLEPVARGYDWALPRIVKRSVTNFFRNLKFPVYLVSDVVQLKFDQAAVHTGRFLVNSTAGIGGLFDVAADIGMKHEYEDFGIALGYHGVDPGPYIVIPFLGPSNARDAFGRIVDAFLTPTYYIGMTDLSSDAALAVSSGLTVLDVVDTRARNLEEVESAKSAALDFYLFVRSAYAQQRLGYINDTRSGDGDEMVGPLQPDDEEEAAGEQSTESEGTDQSE